MTRFGSRVILLLVLDVLLLGASFWHTQYLLNRARLPFLVEEVNGTLVISDLLDPGAASGLTPGFVISTVDGLTVRDYHDVEFLADLRSIGDALQVRGRLGGAERSTVVQLIPFFSLRYAIICLLIGIITLATAVFVLLSRPTDRTAKVLHAVLASLAFSVMLMWGSAPRGDPWTIISRVGYFIFFIGAPASFLHFTRLFPRPPRDLTRTGAVLLYVPAFLVGGLALWTHLHAVLNASVDDYRVFRQVFHLYHFAILVYVALGIANFIRSYRATRAPEDQRKLQWLLWGMTIGPTPFLLLEILPEFFIPLSPIPEEYTLVFLLVIPLSFAVSFIRYRLLDIQVVIHRTTVYGIVLGGSVLIYLGIVAAAASLIGQFTVGASAVSAVLVALAFEPVRRRVHRLVDKRFFRVRYDFRLVQREFVEEMKKRSTAADLARFVVNQVQRFMPVTRIAFVMIPSEGARPFCAAEISVRGFEDQSEFFGLMWKRVVEDQPYGIIAEVEPGAPCLPVEPGTLESAGFALIVPMFAGSSRLIALLVLGRKKSEIRFSSEDIDLLRSIARQVGLEIDRILLQQEVLRKEMEAQRLRDLNELKSSFVSNVSHEFHTPLTSIKLFAELLRSNPSAKDGKSREFLSIIEGEADRLDQMVATILDSSRIERGIRKFAMEECDLGRIVRSVLRTMRYQLRKAGFTVRTVGLSGRSRTAVRCDPQAIFEALVNLIGNALKYSENRRVLTVSLGREGGCVTCSVQDQGAGIPPDVLPHVFEPYYRAPGSERKVEGIGLGLPLVKSIMEAHGGRVEAESIVGKGSCFTLRFRRPTKTRGRRRRAGKPSERS